jgi:fructan beta-fructosidase
MHIIVDRGSIEVFGNRGRIALSLGMVAESKNRSAVMGVEGGAAEIRVMHGHELRSVWR